MISRRSRCVCSASGKRSDQLLREIAAELAAEIGIVRHRRVEQVAVERELGIGEQHRELRPRQRLHCACAARRSPCRRAGIRPRGRAGRAFPASASAAAGSRDPPARAAAPARAPASAGSCCAAPAAPTSSVISASSALRASMRQRARRAPAGSSAILMLTSTSEVLTPAELSIASVLSRTPRERRLDAAALGHAEIGALADHLAAQIGAGDADRRRWRGRRPPRRFRSRRAHRCRCRRSTADRPAPSGSRSSPPAASPSRPGRAASAPRGDSGISFGARG